MIRHRITFIFPLIDVGVHTIRECEKDCLRDFFLERKCFQESNQLILPCFRVWVHSHYFVFYHRGDDVAMRRHFKHFVTVFSNRCHWVRLGDIQLEFANSVLFLLAHRIWHVEDIFQALDVGQAESLHQIVAQSTRGRGSVSHSFECFVALAKLIGFFLSVKEVLNQQNIFRSLSKLFGHNLHLLDEKVF